MKVSTGKKGSEVGNTEPFIQDGCVDIMNTVAEKIQQVYKLYNFRDQSLF